MDDGLGQVLKVNVSKVSRAKDRLEFGKVRLWPEYRRGDMLALVTCATHCSSRCIACRAEATARGAGLARKGDGRGLVLVPVVGTVAAVVEVVAMRSSSGGSRQEVTARHGTKPAWIQSNTLKKLKGEGIRDNKFDID